MCKNARNSKHIPVPDLTTLLANPISSASLAVIGRPVKMTSRARDRPISCGSLTVPPSNRGTPVEFKQNMHISSNKIILIHDPMTLVSRTHHKQACIYNNVTFTIKKSHLIKTSHFDLLPKMVHCNTIGVVQDLHILEVHIVLSANNVMVD